MSYAGKVIPELWAQSQLPESGRHPGRWCHFDADADLPDGPDEVWQAGDFPSAWLDAFTPGPVDAGDTSKEAGLTDRASHEDTPETHSMVQAQPNLEVWPFVAMVQSSHTPTVLTNPHQPDNPILFANDAFLRLTGYGRDEVVGRNCRFLSGPETDREVSNEVRRAVEAARPVSVRILNYRRDGSRIWNQLHISPIFDEAGILAYFVGYQHDITRQVEAEQALLQARQELEERVMEREDLIREVHHRVRNNLQTIIGLLNLEARRGDPLLRRQFDLITQRVRVLGSIHEQLESFDNWTTIDFSRHLREICAALVILFEDRVAVRLDAEPFACNVEAAVSLGLIANELIAASFSHVIGSGAADGALIKVVFRVDQQTNVLELAVSLTRDDQASWSVDDLIHPSDIVDVLAEQMGAQLTLTLDAGPTVRLTVPARRFATGSPAALV
jgi:PAS domain S-box-containing protein